MTERPTLAHIAAEAGVSTATVSMALRGHTRISRQTRSRICQIAERVGYVYDRGAALLRTGRSETVGLLVSDIANPFFAELVAGVDDALEGAGKVALLVNTRESPERQKALLRRLREQSVDGLILCPVAESDLRLLDEIQSWGLPLVQMLRHLSPTRGDYVSLDYRMGVEAAFDHLARLGHRHIAFAGGALRHSASAQRLAGFRASARRHGLVSGMVVPCPATRQGGRETAPALLALSPRPTAVICFNDLVALGLMASLRKAGIAIGSEIAVVGFDNVEEAAESDPALTTLASTPRAVGKEAGQALLRRLADPERPPERIVLPPRLIVRRSCGFGGAVVP